MAERLENKKRLLPKLARRAGAVGLTAAVAFGAWDQLKPTGEYDKFEPSLKRPAQVDNILRIGSWNMHGQSATRYKQIGRLARKYELDALALQEVTANDAKVLHRRMPAWHVVFGLADKKQHLFDGGYGNILLTRQKPRDIKTASLPGSTFTKSVEGTFIGLFEDVAQANTNLSHTKDGWQEGRQALAETIQVYNQGQMIDVRIITGHIAGDVDPSIQNKQFDGLLSFINKNARHTPLSVVCGDFNAGEKEVVPALSHIQMTPLLDSRPTSLSGKKIDHCGYYEATPLGVARLQVPRDPTTDHRPIIYTQELSP